MVSGKRRGSAILMLLTVVGILYMFGTMFVSYMIQERHQTDRLGDSIAAFYLAEAAIEKAMVEVTEIFAGKLIENGEVNDRILSLLDIDRAEDFRYYTKIEEGDLVKDGYAEVFVEVMDLHLTAFKSYIDEREDVPSALKIYRKIDINTYADKALGGWEGKLRFIATGHYKNSSKRIEIMHDLKVSDLTPPAENYTLFISGRGNEYLKQGTFQTRNWSANKTLQGMIDSLIKKTDSAFQDTFGKGAKDMFWEPDAAGSVSFEGDMKVNLLRVIRNLVMNTSDTELKDYVDTTIQQLNPYFWGRIRTNGRLHVHLPFFAADDIINYFEDNSVFSHQRPEIGYLFSNNQLHDPYLSRYTYYEGEIIKYYQKLKPYILGITETPFPSTDLYTLNTKFDFVARNPDKLEPLQLERIVKSVRSYCHELHEGDLTIQGTYGRPGQVWGIIYVQGNLYIGGRIAGQGMIVVDGNIYITDNVVHDSAQTFLSLVSLGGHVAVPKEIDNLRIEAAVYARNSIRGGDQVSIFGNLVVENLNRMDGENGPLIMPKRFFINYDADLKSQTGNNVCFNISNRIITIRNLKLSQPD